MWRLGSILFQFAILLSFLTNSPAKASDAVVLKLNPAGSQDALSLHSTFSLPVSSQYPEYTIQRSTNLQTRETIGAPVSGGVGVSDELLRCAVPLAVEVGDPGSILHEGVGNVNLLVIAVNGAWAMQPSMPGR